VRAAHRALRAHAAGEGGPAGSVQAVGREPAASCSGAQAVAWNCVYHVLLAHAAAVKRFRAIVPGGRISMNINCDWAEPRTSSAADQARPAAAPREAPLPAHAARRGRSAASLIRCRIGTAAALAGTGLSPRARPCCGRLACSCAAATRGPNAADARHAPTADPAHGAAARGGAVPTGALACARRRQRSASWSSRLASLATRSTLASGRPPCARACPTCPSSRHSRRARSAAALPGTLRPHAAQPHAWAMIYSGMWALFRAGCDADFTPDTLGCCAGQSPTLQGPQWGGRAQGADMKGTLDYFALNHYTSLCAPSEASASACPLPVRSCCASARQVAAHVLMAGTSTRASPQRNTGRLDAACSYLLCTACSRQGPTRHQVPDSLATCLL